MANNGFASIPSSFPNHVREAFSPLLLAVSYARQVASDPWEFAIEIDQLTALGLTPNDFRWLVRSGLVKHRREVTLESENGRQFQTAGDLTYCDRSCFVLTDSGIHLAQQLHALDASRSQNSDGQDTTETTIPMWDGERRELRFRGTVVKHFKWIAVNQQAVLCAFEEEGWPPRIDDPLPPQEQQDSKRRLADTIKCLNRKQCYAVIHFRGDGTGEGVFWEIVEVPE